MLAHRPVSVLDGAGGAAAKAEECRRLAADLGLEIVGVTRAAIYWHVKDKVPSAQIEHFPMANRPRRNARLPTCRTRDSYIISCVHHDAKVPLGSPAIKLPEDRRRLHTVVCSVPHVQLR